MKPPTLPTISPAPPKGRIIRYPDGRIIRQTGDGVTTRSTPIPSLTIVIE